MDAANPIAATIAHADTPAARQIRFHCLCGDDLGLGGSASPFWLSARGLRIRDGARGLRRISFLYGAEAGPSLVVEFGLHAPETAAAIEAAVRSMSLEAADRKWRSMMSCLGPVPSPQGAARTQRFVLTGSDIVAARRILHPAPMVDRLMMRDRLLADEAVEAQLFGRTPGPAMRRSA